MAQCPVCGSGNTTERETGQWFCPGCNKVTYMSPEANMQLDFDIEDYLPEDEG